MTQILAGGRDFTDLSALMIHTATDADPDAEAMNIVAAYWHALDRDGPALTWWRALDNHPAIYRALRIDPSDPTARFATASFRLWQSPEGEWLVLAAHPTPRLIGPVDMDHLGISSVLAWNPKTGAASILDDTTPQLFGAFTDPAKGALYADPRAYLRAWAEARAMFIVQCQTHASKDWHARPTEYDLAPGALIVGDLDKIRWNPSMLPAELVCTGVAPQKINRAIIRAARLPSVTGVETGMRAVA